MPTRFGMRDREIGHPERRSGGSVLDFEKIDDQAQTIFSRVGGRTPIAPDESVLNDKAQFRPRERHHSSINAFRPACPSSILFAARRSIFSTGISSIR
jgi:hypothetical protein